MTSTKGLTRIRMSRRVRGRLIRLALSVVFMITCGARAQFGFDAQPTLCDRGCLNALADSYLAGLAANDPGSLPFSTGVRFVENSARLRVGEGLWRTATAPPTTFRIYVPDPESQQIGFMGVMEENGLPVLLALRLEVEDGLITEAEHLIARNLDAANLENLVAPRPAFSSPVPYADRVSRAAMLDIANAYYVALQASDGSAAPFADDCVRRENGMQTTSNPPPLPDEPRSFAIFNALGCAAQLDTRVMSYIDRIDDRRIEIADPETGLVFGLSHFKHCMAEKTLKILGTPGIDVWEMDFDPFDLPAAQIFKIRGGEIHEIEAMGFMVPYQSPTGW